MKKSGDRVDRYIIEALLGRGGMGDVYDALDTRLGRRVALKLIQGDGDPQKNQRMMREARAAAAFEHPNAVVIYDVGEIDGSPFIAMELVRGRSLRAFVGDANVPIGRRLRWLVDTGRALAAAHRAGLVHRDIKPDNVMVRDDGVVKVLDFGIARRQRTAIDPNAPTAAQTSGFATLTERGVVVGTPRYSAPEQLRSEDIDGRADQFSWGVLAYELLTGVSPWSADDALGLLSQILSGETPPARTRCPELPEPVEQTIFRALAKRAADRFPTIDDAADSLEPFADAAPTPGRREAGLSSPSVRPGEGVDTDQAHTVGTPAVRVLKRTARIGVVVLATFGGLIVVLLTVAALAGKFHVDLGPKRDPNAPLVIDGLGCEPATVEGDALGSAVLPAASVSVPAKPARLAQHGPVLASELARAVGIGACARLATDIGVDWNVPNAAHKLETRAKVTASGAEVHLKVGEREASGTGATPVDAMAVATEALAKQLARKPMTPAEVASWGAKDEASARAIERVWRRLVLNVAPDDDAAVKGLVQTDPESPWTHAMVMLLGSPGMEQVDAERERALALVDKLPPNRAHGLKALLLIYASADNLKESMRLFRQAYAEAPDDPDIAGLYAAVAISLAPEEGFAVVDRLYEKFPTRSIIPVANAFSNAFDRDLERNRKYIGWLRATFPESVAWGANVQEAVLEGDFDEARAALDFGRRFGMTGPSADRSNFEWNGAWVELAARQPKEARETAAHMLGDPRVRVSTAGAGVTVASYFMEGRITDAELALWREFDRARTTGSPVDAAELVREDLCVRRWLGRPPPSADRMEFLDKAVQALRALALSSSQPEMRSELALARAGGAAGKSKAAEALRELEAAVEKDAAGEMAIRDSMLVGLLPLVRLVHGDKEAARRWIEADHASFASRRRVAFDAGLAFEALGDKERAQKAYELAADPIDLRREAFQAMAAAVRLAKLHREAGRADEASRLETMLARVWARADPGIRDAVTRIK